MFSQLLTANLALTKKLRQKINRTYLIHLKSIINFVEQIIIRNAKGFSKISTALPNRRLYARSCTKNQRILLTFCAFAYAS